MQDNTLFFALPAQNSYGRFRYIMLMAVGSSKNKSTCMRSTSQIVFT